MKINIATLLFGLMAGVIVLLPASAEKGTKHEVDGKQVFEQHCASCHTGGGNDIATHHPVAGSSQLASLATFKSYLSMPPGHMPYYKDVVGDKETLQALYKYCKQLKKVPIEKATIDGTQTAKLN